MKDPTFYIEQKLKLLQTIGQVTMLWWVTVIVLCATTIVAAWKHRDEIHNRAHVHLGGIAVFFLFTLFLAYGYFVLRYVNGFSADVRPLLKLAGANETVFDAEVIFFRRAMYTALLDYVVLFLAWVVVWISLARHVRRKANA